MKIFDLFIEMLFGKKKICSTCENWKRYRKLDTRCLCEGGISGGNYSEVYTESIDSCKCWKEWKYDFSAFRKTIKPKRKI